jgi:hypothetical protein
MALARDWAAVQPHHACLEVDIVVWQWLPVKEWIAVLIPQLDQHVGFATGDRLQRPTPWYDAGA